VRILCGVCEAAIPSALMLLSSQYYTRSEQTTRFSYWYCGMGVAQILGGLFSWAFQHMTRPVTAALTGWRIMFLAIGLFTVLLGIAILVAVPDTPMSAWFLSDEEKLALLEHIKVNQSGIEDRRFQPRQLLEGALDFQLWCMFVIVALVSR
jgi:MFS family permease